jgi:hypothetical protein
MRRDVRNRDGQSGEQRVESRRRGDGVD